MFELKHLKTLLALEQTNNLRQAADLVFMSQSAVSHQIKNLEQRIGKTLFLRNTMPVEFTEEGKYLLLLAKQIMPLMREANDYFKYGSQHKNWSIAFACHSCFQWLIPIIEQFNQQYSEIKLVLADEIYEHQNAVKIDLLFTDTCIENDGFDYITIGHFDIVAVMAKQHAWAKERYITAEMFNSECLLTYPVAYDSLDLVNLFLNPESQKRQLSIAPKAVKQVANSLQLLQKVAANMGVAAVPAWLVSSLALQSFILSKPLGSEGVSKALFLRLKKQQAPEEIMALIPKIKQAFVRLNEIKQ
jgi:LysR family transcriptional regulator for metE and metH